MLDTKTLVAAMARRCGLEDPDQFALAGGVAARSSAVRDTIARFTGEPWAPPKDLKRALRLRGTGRTTRMLLEVLVALQCGCKVDIETYDEGLVPDLGLRLVELCLVGRIDMSTFHYNIRTSLGSPLADAEHFSDHFVAELAERAKREARIDKAAADLRANIEHSPDSSST